MRTDILMKPLDVWFHGLALSNVANFDDLGQMQLNSASLALRRTRRSSGRFFNAPATDVFANFRHVIIELGLRIHHQLLPRTFLPARVSIGPD